MLTGFDAEEIRFILAHEWYHVVHRDLLRKLLVSFLNCLNWFNPLYYLLRKNLSEWMRQPVTRKLQRIYEGTKAEILCELMIKILELEQSRYVEEFCSVGFMGASINSYKSRMIKNYEKK